jgi:hypothetical protein
MWWRIARHRHSERLIMLRRPEIRFTFVVAIAAGVSTATLAGAFAQSPPAAPPPATSPTPYKAVPLTLPKPVEDAGFVALRRQLAGIAERRDRAALARLIVRQGFFWERESGDGADRSKSGIDNFAKAIGLDLPEDSDIGWDTIAIYANDPTAAEMDGRKGVLCGPADPEFNIADLQALLDSSRSDLGEWVYPVVDGLEVRAEPSDKAPVIEKIGLIFLRLLPGDAPGDPANPADEAGAGFTRLMSPSGKIGFAKADDVASLGVGQICYAKRGGAWKIVGVIGDGEE